MTDATNPLSIGHGTFGSSEHPDYWAGGEPGCCPDCGYQPGQGDDPLWCFWCEAPLDPG